MSFVFGISVKYMEIDSPSFEFDLKKLPFEVRIRLHRLMRELYSTDSYSVSLQEHLGGQRHLFLLDQSDTAQYGASLLV